MQSNLLALCYRAGVIAYSFVEIYSVNPAHSGTTHWTLICYIYFSNLPHTDRSQVGGPSHKLPAKARMSRN